MTTDEMLYFYGALLLLAGVLGAAVWFFRSYVMSQPSNTDPESAESVEDLEE